MGKASRHDDQKAIGSAKKAHTAAVRRAKVELPFRLCDLRHTFATQVVASSTDLPTLSPLLGHASKLITMRCVPSVAEQKRVAIKKLETFNAEGLIGAATTDQRHGATTEVTTMERMNEWQLPGGC